MGVMRFLVSSPPILENWPDVYRAYMTGADGRVYPTRVEVEGAVITCRRMVSDSGRLYVAWPVEGFGTPVICTASLTERAEPYLLTLELAGKNRPTPRPDFRVGDRRHDGPRGIS